MGAESVGDGTVGKALDILDMVAQCGRPVRFTELLLQAGYPKATLYRFLQTLTNQGMLTFDPDRQTYALGVRLVRLAHAAWAQSSLAPIARPWIDKLSDKVGETIHLAQLDQAHVLYVDKRNARRPVEMFAQAGKIGPAYCTGVGKAMLAFLTPEALEPVLAQQAFVRFTDNTIVTQDALRAELAVIRKRGYALDRQEHEPEIICVALPVLSRAGRVIGAISVTSTTGRTTIGALEALVPDIRQTAAAIAEEAENWRFPDHE